MYLFLENGDRTPADFGTVRDVSGLSFGAIQTILEEIRAAGLTPMVFVKNAELPLRLTESWLNTSTTYGLVRRYCSTVEVSSRDEALRLVEAAEMKKPPTDADRIKQRHKQEVLLQKKRQNDELLRAQQRELDKQAHKTT